MKKRKQDVGKKMSLKEKLADSVDMSKEIILDTAKIIFIGPREVTVENYKSIIEYTDSKIILDSKPSKLNFEGTNLEVKTITQEFLKRRFADVCNKFNR